MAEESRNIDFWALKPAELAYETRMIANGEVPAADEKQQAESKELAAEWHEIIQVAKVNFDDQANRAARIASLRKRTIEILVKVYGSN
jgi:hypothetical protein